MDRDFSGRTSTAYAYWRSDVVRSEGFEPLTVGLEVPEAAESVD